ncbi:hypothetical protein M422DRAFT_260389 [Sphaerobolus stellatus SS14]|uniref:FAD-binding domain-containing protein n=1 Tax=Sphaerobolus stellatus (strain SS14) TaxID=990650 RepID=A0A0C9VI73_SPHS4|nr:hypothetical protein M422DRAFT_260389 [Sphaerobolus stellatus SS14]
MVRERSSSRKDSRGTVLNTIDSTDRIVEEGTPLQGPALFRISHRVVNHQLGLKHAFDKVPFLGSDRIVVGYQQDGDASAVVSFEDGSSIKTRYIVGANGARSTIRKLAGIDFRDPFNGDSYDEPPILPALNYVLADVYLELPFPPAIQLDRVMGIMNPFFFIVPFSATSDGKEVLCRIALKSIEGRELTVLEVTTESRYHTRSTLAANYFKKNGNYYILLVGDAAYIDTPLGGQCMNLGICDGVAIAHAIRRHIDACNSSSADADAILAKCTDRRREIGLSVIGGTQTFNYLIYWKKGRRRIVRNIILAVLI